MYVRIVEVEASLDAKSDDTLDVRDGKKILSLWFPLETKAYSGTQKATMAKKKKERSVQNRPKNCVLEKDFVSCDTLFGLC